MISSDCFTHIWVLSRGMVSPAVVLVSPVGKNVVLRVHILALKVGPFRFYNTTSVLPQCTTSLTSLCLNCILFLGLLSGVIHAIFLKFLLQNCLLPRSTLLVRCCVSIVQGFWLRGGIHTDLGVLPGRHVLSNLLGGFHTFLLLPLHICIHCVLFLWGYICLQIIMVSL